MKEFRCEATERPVGKPEKPRKCSKWRTKAEAVVIPAPVCAHGSKKGISRDFLGARAA